jgi:membrane protein required for colicin V production
MNWVDYAIVGVLLLSALTSLVRGFAREALSLAGWVLAFWVGIAYAPELAARFAGDRVATPVAVGVAFVVLLLVTLVVAGLVNYLVGQLVDRTGLDGTDRLLGLVFGVARGAVVVAALVLLGGLTIAPETGWWRESVLLGHFTGLALWLRDLLPADIAAAIRF